MIQVKSTVTPNPEVMKFQFSENLIQGQHQFNSPQEAFHSPLAMKLFGFPWTTSVCLGENFVSVEKAKWVEWEHLCSPLEQLIAEHLQSGEGVLQNLTSTNTTQDSPSRDPLVLQIIQVIKSEIRPVALMDGGDIEFAKFENGIVYVKMMGACSGCPSQTATLKQGLGTRLLELSKDIKEVRAI